jgi:hypothetical protein
MIAFNPEAQTLLMVVASDETGILPLATARNNKRTQRRYRPAWLDFVQHRQKRHFQGKLPQSCLLKDQTFQ